MDRVDTSWEGASEWYGRLTGTQGHYYQRHVVIPGSLRLLDLREGSSLLDLACGQGVLARHIPTGVHYEGIDAAPSLISEARRLDKDRKHRYFVADISRPLPTPKRDFTHAAIVLALQNIPDPGPVMGLASEHLAPGGRLLIVINHPCFRIPRQSSWGMDEQNKAQYRRVDRYMTPMKIPIATNPGSGQKSPTTWSYHFPLSRYARCLNEAGFAIGTLEEWVSDRRSVGRAARMENRARAEFPLFLALLARKA